MAISKFVIACYPSFGLQFSIKLIMKKITLSIIFFFVFILFGCEQKPIIEDYKIEGIGIGDSLLNHISKYDIIDGIEKNRPFYNYLNDEFGEVYLYDNLSIYDRVSFFVKPNDENYIIYSIRGSISYDNKLDECLARRKEIEEEFSSIFKKAKKEYWSGEYPFDPTGESKNQTVTFYLDTGDSITAGCSKFEKNLKIINGFEDSLSVAVDSKEVRYWFSQSS